MGGCGDLAFKVEFILTMIIVTGGAGFIGSAFVAAANAAGRDDIIVVDELGTSEKWKNLRGKHILDYLEKDRFHCLLEQHKFPAKPEAVVHLGACSSTTEQDAAYMMETNYRSTKLIAEWALRENIRFIYSSSAATYGDGSLGFSDADETTLQLKPLNIYALSKQLIDVWAVKTGAAQKMAGIKFFNVYGPNEYHKGGMTSVVYQAFNQISSTGKLRLFKSYRPDFADGEQKRDFVYVKDCCQVLLWFLEQPGVNGIFNLGSGAARTWIDLAHAVFSAMGRRPQIEFIEMPQALREKYQYFTQADVSRLKSYGCPVKFASLEEGIKDYVRGYLMKEDQCL